MGNYGDLILEAEQGLRDSEKQKENLEDLVLPKAWVELHITDGQKGRYPSGLRRDIKRTVHAAQG